MIRLTREKALPALLVSSSIVLALAEVGCASQASLADTAPAAVVTSPSFPPAAQTPPAAQNPQPAQTAWSPDELNQLVAPIALYPDALVAQIVAAASDPTEVVEADRWMQQNSSLKGTALATAANSQSWDPSVKALTQFPSVLAMLDKNLSWTSALGEAYVAQPQKVLDAVQTMRQRAQQAGNLKTTPQENVTTEGQTIAIEPANPDVVYVPEYDPWDVYGEPLAFYPGWVGYPGVFAGPGIFFGLGIGIGAFGGFGWGWNHWGADWHHHEVVYNHNAYHPHSSTFGHDRGFGDHNHFGSAGHGFAGHAPTGAGHAATGEHSSAFSGFNHGGVANAYSSRGRVSAGAGPHGGGSFAGGGFHGGGGSHGGGGHR